MLNIYNMHEKANGTEKIMGNISLRREKKKSYDGRLKRQEIHDATSRIIALLLAASLTGVVISLKIRFCKSTLPPTDIHSPVRGLTLFFFFKALHHHVKGINEGRSGLGGKKKVKNLLLLLPTCKD